MKLAVVVVKEFAALTSGGVLVLLSLGDRRSTAGFNDVTGLEFLSTEERAGCNWVGAASPSDLAAPLLTLLTRGAAAAPSEGLGLLLLGVTGWVDLMQHQPNSFFTHNIIKKAFTQTVCCQSIATSNPSRLSSFMNENKTIQLNISKGEIQYPPNHITSPVIGLGIIVHRELGRQ